MIDVNIWNVITNKNRYENDFYRLYVQFKLKHKDYKAQMTTYTLHNGG